MTQRHATIILLLVLLLFVITDHSSRPEPDHYQLEVWRGVDYEGSAGCAPCGAVCDDKS